MTDEDRDAFEQLVQAHAASLYRYAAMLARDRHTAEDIVQEALLRAWRFRRTLREPEKVRGWLITMVRREHARLFERKTLPMIDDFPLEIVSAGTPPESDPEQIAIRKALLELPLKYREPLVLQVLYGYSGHEIGELLGIPRPTVNTRLFRAREMLRGAMEGISATTTADG